MGRPPASPHEVARARCVLVTLLLMFAAYLVGTILGELLSRLHEWLSGRKERKQSEYTLAGPA